jgi:hypothetical protein
VSSGTPVPYTVIGGDVNVFARFAESWTTLAARARTPHRPRSITVWADVFTSDMRYQEMASALADALPNAVPKSSYVATDFSLVRCMQTVTGTPAGTPPVDAFARALVRVAESKVDLTPATRAMRAEYVRTREYTARSKALAAVYYDRLLRTAIWVAAPIRRSSSTALPHMSSDLATKTAIIDQWLKNAARYGRAWRQRRFEELLSEGVWVAFLNGYRSQADSTQIMNGVAVPKKERTVYTARGKWEVTDRRASALRPPKGIKNTAAWPTFVSQVCGTRPRQLSQSGFCATIPLRCSARAVEAGVYDNYPFTFHHHGQEDILRKTAGALAWSITDVSNHDQVMAPLHVGHVSRRFGVIFGGIAEDYVSVLHHAPSISHGDHYGERGYVVHGDITRPHEAGNEVGNPSGINTTSITAKAVGAFYDLDGLANFEEEINIPPEERISRPDPDAVDAFLEGRAAVQILNLGDNNFRVTRDPRYVPYVMAPWRWQPYVDVEASDTFSGYLVVGSHESEPRLVPNIETLVRNTIVPDRPVGHDMRGHPALALSERSKVYAVHPDGQKVIQVMNAHTLHYLGASLQQLADRTPVPPTIARFANALDATDDVLQFLRNRDVIEYKVDPRSIPSDLLDQYYLSIPAAACEAIALSFFEGK